MSRFVEFRTDLLRNDQHSQFARNNPLHDGKLPSRFREVKGVRVDGEALYFLDETVPERIQFALRQGAKLKKSKRVFDCIAFAALSRGIEITDNNERTLRSSQLIDDSFGKALYADDLDESNTADLELGTILPNDAFYYSHTVSPAHTTQSALYMHKLGSDGPVCLSDLRSALGMYQASVAFPIQYNLL